MDWREINFINADDVKPLLTGMDVVSVRPSSFSHLIAFVMFSIVFLGSVLVYFAYHYPAYIPESLPQPLQDWFVGLPSEAPYVCFWVGSFALLFSWMGQKMYFKSLGVRGWLIQATAKGVFIQYRSYLNQNFDPRDETVVYVPAALISSLREVRLWKTHQDHDGKTYQHFKYVEFEVRRIDKDLIVEKIEAESNRRTSYGARWHAEPVEVLDRSGAAVLRVEFSGMKPKANAFVEKMSRWYMTKPEKKLGMKQAEEGRGLRNKLKLIAVKNKNHSYTQDDILEAVRRGDTVAAVRAARAVYDCGLKEAKDYVDSLDVSGSRE